MNGRTKDIREKPKANDNSFAENAPLKPTMFFFFNEILKRDKQQEYVCAISIATKSTSTCLLLFPFPYEEHQWQKQGQIRKNNKKGQRFCNKRRTSETSVVEKNINETERYPCFLLNGVDHPCLGIYIELNQSQLSSWSSLTPLFRLCPKSKNTQVQER